MRPLGYLTIMDTSPQDTCPESLASYWGLSSMTHVLFYASVCVHASFHSVIYYFIYHHYYYFLLFIFLFFPHLLRFCSAPPTGSPRFHGYPPVSASGSCDAWWGPSPFPLLSSSSLWVTGDRGGFPSLRRRHSSTPYA